MNVDLNPAARHGFNTQTIMRCIVLGLTIASIGCSAQAIGTAPSSFDGAAVTLETPETPAAPTPEAETPTVDTTPEPAPAPAPSPTPAPAPKPAPKPAPTPAPAPAPAPQVPASPDDGPCGATPCAPPTEFSCTPPLVPVLRDTMTCELPPADVTCPEGTHPVLRDVITCEPDGE
jgi:hypothetical protein